MTPTPERPLPPLVCVREADHPRRTIVPPTVQVTTCSVCQERVFISKVSRDMVRTGQARVICHHCVAEEARRTQQTFIAVMTPEQAEELREIRRADIERN